MDKFKRMFRIPKTIVFVLCLLLIPAITSAKPVIEFYKATYCSFYFSGDFEDCIEWEKIDIIDNDTLPSPGRAKELWNLLKHTKHNKYKVVLKWPLQDLENKYMIEEYIFENFADMYVFTRLFFEYLKQ